MSKRKNRAPNIPKETLERARLQAEGMTEEDAAAAARVQETLRASDREKTTSASGLSRAERRQQQGVTARRSTRASARTNSAGLPEAAPRPRRRRSSDELTVTDVEYLLEHPTKTVTEAELRQQYTYVLNDLRNMALLAAGLFVLLIVLAQVV